MKPLKCVIMQPTYLPWVGYLDLMDQADVFIYLDTVQFAKRSWQQRNRIRTPQGELMLTVPVLSKGARDQEIREVLIDASAGFQKKHLRSVEQAYAKAPCFKSFAPELRTIYEQHPTHLCELNIALIEWAAIKLGITSRRVRATGLPHGGQKVDLLLSLCQAVGATHYLSAPGSKVYIDEDNRFGDHGIELAYHEYSPAPYPQVQGGEFLPYMSFVDLLANAEPTEALRIIRAGRK